MRIITLLVLALLASPLALAVDPADPVPGVPDGFTVTPVAALPVPTALAFGPGDHDGPDLYATTLTGNVMRVALAWTPAGVPVATGVSVFAGGFGQPLGLAFHGDALLVAESVPATESGRGVDGQIVRTDTDGTRTVILGQLPNGRHNTNNIAFGPDGRLYVTNGNPNDNGIDGGEPDALPLSGAILAVDVDEVTQSPAILRWVDEDGNRIPADAVASHPVNADFRAKVDVFATGFRNVYDVTFHPVTGLAYTATNGADVPSSQDAFYRITPGTDYGYPFCFNGGLPGAVGEDVSKRANPVFPDHDCSRYPPADALLGWHVCATGLDVPTDGPWAFPEALRNSVFVAECGPFFVDDTLAQMQAEGSEGVLVAHRNLGHKVTRVALDADGHATSVTDFLDGLALPTDVLFGPDGAMYVADAEGVLRVAPVVPEVTAPLHAAVAGSRAPREG